MASLKAKFDKAVKESKTLPEKPDNATLLKIYALYKQATGGDVEGKRPGFTDLVGRAKWDAWNALKGKSDSEAMQIDGGRVGNGFTLEAGSFRDFGMTMPKSNGDDSSKPRAIRRSNVPSLLRASASCGASSTA